MLFDGLRERELFSEAKAVRNECIVWRITEAIMI